MAPQSPVLFVRAKVEGDVVYYDVLSGDSEATATLKKTTRFSELSNLHAALLRDIPDFTGVLPRKTMRKKLAPAFVESRRADIELYLRMVVAQKDHSNAFQEFFDTAEEERPARKVDETETASLGATTTDAELVTELARKEMDVKLAKDKKRELEKAMSTGENQLEATKAAATSKVANETNATNCLEEHRRCLRDISTDISSKRVSRRDKACEQRLAADRLGEELAAASAATEAARAQVERARRERLEADAVSKAHVSQLDASVINAEEAGARTDELKLSAAAVMGLMKDRARSRAADAAGAERTCAARVSASRDINSKRDEATLAQRSAEELARSTTRSLAAHKEDAARRARAHEADVRRAEECAAMAAALRDVRSRTALASEDRMALSDAQREAEEAANTAKDTLRAAKVSAEETHAADQKQAETLAASVKKAADQLSRRTVIADAVLARCSECEEAARAAEAAHGAAKSASQAAEEEVGTIERRHEEYVTTHSACVAQLAAVRDAAAKARTKAAADQVPLRHAEDAEAAVLARREAAEAGVVQALDAARTAAADFSDTHGSGLVSTADNDVLVTSCQARLADRERLLEEADAARTAAAAALSAGRDDLSQQKSSLHAMGPSGSPRHGLENAESVEQEPEEHAASHVARIEARCAESEKVCHEKAASYAVAAEAVEAARVELRTLAAQQNTKAKVSASLDSYVQLELSCVEKVLEGRKQRIASALAESDNRVSAWADERDGLTADLHRAKLQLSVAEEGVSATRSVRKSLER